MDATAAELRPLLAHRGRRAHDARGAGAVRRRLRLTGRGRGRKGAALTAGPGGQRLGVERRRGGCLARCWAGAADAHGWAGGWRGAGPRGKERGPAGRFQERGRKRGKILFPFLFLLQFSKSLFKFKFQFFLKSLINSKHSQNVMQQHVCIKKFLTLFFLNFNSTKFIISLSFNAHTFA